MSHYTIKASGMHCRSCKLIVQEALEEKGAENINITIDEKTNTGMISCDFEGPVEQLKATIRNEGYDA